MAHMWTAVGGPRPVIPPALFVALYAFFLMVGAGPAYSSAAVREFLQNSHFLPEDAKSNALVLRSLNAFQAADVMGGAVIGFVLDWVGPRWTHAILGQAIFAAGLLMMRWQKTLYTGCLLQGIASVAMLTSVLHLANLFERRSRLVMNILTAVVDLSAMVFPLAALLVRQEILSGVSCLWTLAGISFVAFAITVLIFPDTPFLPRSSVLKLLDEDGPIRLESGGSRRDIWASSDAEVAKLVASRRKAGASSNPNKPPYSTSPMGDEETQALFAPFPVPPSHWGGGSATPSVSSSELGVASGRNFSVSVACLRPSSTSARGVGGGSQKNWFSELARPQWYLPTLFYAFSTLRQNLYIDANEDLLNLLGDQDGSLLASFQMMLPFCFIFGIINGCLMEAIGVVPTACYLNACGVLVSFVSGWNILPPKLHLVTFVLFCVNRASTLSTLFTYLAANTEMQFFSILSGLSMVVGGCGLLFVNTRIADWVIRSNDSTKWMAAERWMFALGLVAFLPLALMHFCTKKHPPAKDAKTTSDNDDDQENPEEHRMILPSITSDAD